jgi:hypothetical protein
MAEMKGAAMRFLKTFWSHFLNVTNNYLLRGIQLMGPILQMYLQLHLNDGYSV